MLDGASCSWKVKLSPTVCLSTQQAEYYALSEGTKETLNLRFLQQRRKRLSHLGMATS